MNEFKKALIDVAGDTNSSEQAVKNAILHNKPRRKKIPFFIVPAFLVAVLLIGFTLWLLPKQADPLQSSRLLDNELLFEFEVAREEVINEGFDYGDLNIKNGYANFKQIIGVLEVARLEKITITEEQRAKRKTLTKLMSENEQFLVRVLDKANISRQQYEKEILPILTDSSIVREQLNARWHDEKYPHMLNGIDDAYTSKIVADYMDQYYAEELEVFKVKHEIQLSDISPQVPDSGVVAAIEGDMFYFIQNMTAQELATLSKEEIIQNREGKYSTWIVNNEEIPVRVGDYIKVRIGGYTTDDETSTTLAVHNGFEVILPAEQASEIEELTLSTEQAEEWNSLLGKMEWQIEQTMNNFSKPLYIIHTADATYTVWKTEYKNFLIVPFGEYKISKITQGKTKKMEQLLTEIRTK